EPRSPVSNRLALIERRMPPCVFATAVEVEIPLGEVEFERTQALISPNQVLGTVAIHGHVGQGGVAVAPHTISAKGMKAQPHLLFGPQPTGGGAQASTPDTAVKRARSSRGSEQCTRVDALAEIAAHGEDFVVSPAGLECRLDHEVRGSVGRVVGVQ